MSVLYFGSASIACRTELLLLVVVFLLNLVSEQHVMMFLQSILPIGLIAAIKKCPSLGVSPLTFRMADCQAGVLPELSPWNSRQPSS